MSAAERVDLELDLFAGEDRYDTAKKIAEATYGDDAPMENIIIASGISFPDALAGNALAGAAGAPILLTRPNSLPAPTRAAIENLSDADTTFWFLGGEMAISDDVIGQVLAINEPENGDVDLTSTAVRINGASRYDTAIEIATFIDDNLELGTSFGGLRTAFVTVGDNFADALAIGPVAYSSASPVLLVPRLPMDSTQEEAELNADVAKVLGALIDLDIDSVVILGGEAAVAPSIEAAITWVLNEEKVSRISGANRFETAANIADFARDQLAFNHQNVLIARAEQGNDQAFADALAGGTFGGEIGVSILLVAPDSLPAATAAWLDDNDNVIRKLWRLGGAAAVSNQVMIAARNAAQTTAVYRLSNQTDAPELQFVREVAGLPNVIEYVFDEPVTGSSLFASLGPDGEFLALTAYTTECGGLLMWVNPTDATDIRAALTAPVLLPGPPPVLFDPLLDEDGIQLRAAGDSEGFFATNASILGNGNVIRAEFPIASAQMQRATVRFGAVSDEDGLRSIEAGYPVNPRACPILGTEAETGLPRLVDVRRWANAPSIVDIQRITVDYYFRNANPAAERTAANDRPTWLLGAVDTLGDFDPSVGAFGDSAPHASQFWLVADNSQLYQGALISFLGTGQTDNGYRVRVFFDFDQSVVPAGALRRGFVRDTDGDGVLEEEVATDLVQSAGYSPALSPNITQDPDLTGLTGPINFGADFRAFEFFFDEAISDDADELNTEFFRVYGVVGGEYVVSEEPAFVDWKAGANSRVAIAYWPTAEITALGTLAGGFVEDISRDDGVEACCSGAVRGTDTPQNFNLSWNRAAEVSLTLDFADATPGTVQVLPAGYTSEPDLYRMLRRQNPVTTNWETHFQFDPFGGNICAVDVDVTFNLYDNTGTRTSFVLVPNDLDISLADSLITDDDRRAWCVPGANTVYFDGGPDPAYFTNDSIVTAIIGGVEPILQVDGEGGLFFFNTEGSAVINGGVRFPAGAGVVPAGVS